MASAKSRVVPGLPARLGISSNVARLARADRPEQLTAEHQHKRPTRYGKFEFALSDVTVVLVVGCAQVLPKVLATVWPQSVESACT